MFLCRLKNNNSIYKHKPMSMKKLLIPLIFLSISSFCQEKEATISKYPASTGDIDFDSNLDKKDFQLCGKGDCCQYFNDEKGLIYEGEKKAIENEFKEKYRPENVKKETGSIRIRFLVNCKGETDRFRVIGMDNNFQEKVFDKSITEQLVTISKGLKGWKTKNFYFYKKNEKLPYDYYQYLIFKIKDGQITEILP
jgi:hypothetical protein